jgi:GNAT superfamily N-acetyltransferase
MVVVAEADGELAGVGQRGRRGADHVVYKLYVHPGHRGRGLGQLLLDALAGRLPADADRLCVEHFAANERAGAFYEREGFTVDRVEPGPSGDPALAIVWRSCPLGRPGAAT